MIKLLMKVPKKINLAFSGGVDSLAAAHFLNRGKHEVTLLHFNHGCEYSDHIERMVRHVVEHDLGGDMPLIVQRIESGSPNKGQSLEDYWRRARYRFLRSFDEQFITCHHLDDAVETWVWSSLHGEGKIIPAKDDKVLRPFLLTEKSELIDYARKNHLHEVFDEYNFDKSLTRNYIRANIMPHAYHVNPGLKKVIRKKYLKEL